MVELLVDIFTLEMLTCKERLIRQNVSSESKLQRRHHLERREGHTFLSGKDDSE